MYKQKAKELIETDEIWNNPACNIYPDECESLWQTIVACIRDGDTTTAMAVFKATLGIGFKAGREDAKLDVFRE